MRAFIFIITIILLSTSVFALSLTDNCYISADCTTDTAIASVNSAENTHVSQDSTLGPQKICCPGTDLGQSSACTGSQVAFYLYQTSNSHAADTTNPDGTYTEEVCLGADSTGVTCTTSASCGATEKCVIALKYSTNSHVAQCGTVGYDEDICCETSGGSNCGNLIIEAPEECDGNLNCIGSGNPGECTCDDTDYTRSPMLDVTYGNLGCCITASEYYFCFSASNCWCRDTVSSCGDSIVTGIEECESPDNGLTWGTGCTDDWTCECDTGYQPTIPAGLNCELIPVCGNGIVEIGEGCDDGNTNNNDGCSDSCAQEICYTCVGEPSSCTPDSEVCTFGTIDEDCDGDTNWDSSDTFHGDNDCGVEIIAITLSGNPITSGDSIDITCTVNDNDAGYNSIYTFIDNDNNGVYSAGDLDLGWQVGDSWNVGFSQVTFRNRVFTESDNIVCDVYSSATEPDDRSYQIGTPKSEFLTVNPSLCSARGIGTCAGDGLCKWVTKCQGSSPMYSGGIDRCVDISTVITYVCSVIQCSDTCDGSSSNTCPEGGIDGCYGSGVTRTFRDYISYNRNCSDTCLWDDDPCFTPYYVYGPSTPQYESEGCNECGDGEIYTSEECEYNGVAWGTGCNEVTCKCDTGYQPASPIGMNCDPIPGVEICTNGEDDDLDGLIDWDDDDCAVEILDLTSVDCTTNTTIIEVNSTVSIIGHTCLKVTLDENTCNWGGNWNGNKGNFSCTVNTSTIAKSCTKNPTVDLFTYINDGCIQIGDNITNEIHVLRENCNDYTKEKDCKKDKSCEWCKEPDCSDSKKKKPKKEKGYFYQLNFGTCVSIIGDNCPERICSVDACDSECDADGYNVGDWDDDGDGDVDCRDFEGFLGGWLVCDKNCEIDTSNCNYDGCLIDDDCDRDLFCETWECVDNICVYGPHTCDDNEPCTVDSCDEFFRCIYDDIPCGCYSPTNTTECNTKLDEDPATFVNDSGCIEEIDDTYQACCTSEFCGDNYTFKPIEILS